MRSMRPAMNECALWLKRQKSTAHGALRLAYRSKVCGGTRDAPAKRFAFCRVDRPVDVGDRQCNTINIVSQS
jgi:hypothetical protein